MHKQSSSGPYLSTPEVAEMLGLSVQTLERYRRENRGLPYVRIEGAVRYRRADIERELALATIYPTGT